MLTLCLCTLAWVLSDADLLCEWWCRDAGASRTQPHKKLRAAIDRAEGSAGSSVRLLQQKRPALRDNRAMCAAAATFDRLQSLTLHAGKSHADDLAEVLPQKTFQDTSHSALTIFRSADVGMLCMCRAPPQSAAPTRAPVQASAAVPRARQSAADDLFDGARQQVCIPNPRLSESAFCHQVTCGTLPGCPEDHTSNVRNV